MALQRATIGTSESCRSRSTVDLERGPDSPCKANCSPKCDWQWSIDEEMKERRVPTEGVRLDFDNPNKPRRVDSKNRKECVYRDSHEMAYPSTSPCDSTGKPYHGHHGKPNSLANGDHDLDSVRMYRELALSTWWFSSSSFTYSAIGLAIMFCFLGDLQRNTGESYAPIWYYEAWALIIQGPVSWLSDVWSFGGEYYSTDCGSDGAKDCSTFYSRVDRTWATTLFAMQLIKSYFVEMDTNQFSIYGIAIVAAIYGFVSAQLCHCCMAVLMDQVVEEEVIARKIASSALVQAMELESCVESHFQSADLATLEAVGNGEGGTPTETKDTSKVGSAKLQIKQRSTSSLQFLTIGDPTELVETYLLPAAGILVPQCRQGHNKDGDSGYPSNGFARRTNIDTYFYGFMFFHTVWHYSLPMGAFFWCLYTNYIKNQL